MFYSWLLGGAVWLSYNALVWINEVTLRQGPANTWMGDHLQVGKLSRYVTAIKVDLT